jgi:hypothetical protein
MKYAIQVGILLTATACARADLGQIDYLGQTPPGDEVVVFAPDIVSTENREHGVPVFSPDGRDVYFSRQYEGRHDILRAHNTNGAWSAPEVVPFTSDALDDGPTFFPVDGRLFFGSRRATVPGGEPQEHTDIWYVTRDGDNWGEPVRLNPPVNSGTSNGYPCFTTDGTMYFHSDRGGDSTLADIYRAGWNGHGFEKPEALPAPINSPRYEAGPYVAPDESYLIYMQVDFANPDATHLNLTFRTDENTWTEPIDLAETLGLPGTDLLLGRVSPDQRYLFVLAGGDVYWVDAGIIEELRGR